MSDKITVYRGYDGLWYWHVKAPNNKIIMDGAEGYSSRWAARRAMLRATTRPTYGWLIALLLAVIAFGIGLFSWYILEAARQDPNTALSKPTQSVKSTVPLKNPSDTSDTDINEPVEGVK